MSDRAPDRDIASDGRHVKKRPCSEHRLRTVVVVCARQLLIRWLNVYSSSYHRHRAPQNCLLAKGSHQYNSDTTLVGPYFIHPSRSRNCYSSRCLQHFLVTAHVYACGSSTAAVEYRDHAKPTTSSEGIHTDLQGIDNQALRRAVLPR